jgi:hypothetical protein
MLTGEMAKYQIQDRIREAEQGRIGGATRRDRVRTPVVRRVASGLLAAVGPRRKATPTAGATGVGLAR